MTECSARNGTPHQWSGSGAGQCAGRERLPTCTVLQSGDQTAAHRRVRDGRDGPRSGHCFACFAEGTGSQSREMDDVGSAPSNFRMVSVPSLQYLRVGWFRVFFGERCLRIPPLCMDFEMGCNRHNRFCGPVSGWGPMHPNYLQNLGVEISGVLKSFGNWIKHLQVFRFGRTE